MALAEANHNGEISSENRSNNNSTRALARAGWRPARRRLSSRQWRWLGHRESACAQQYRSAWRKYGSINGFANLIWPALARLMAVGIAIKLVVRIIGNLSYHKKHQYARDPAPRQQALNEKAVNIFPKCNAVNNEARTDVCWRASRREVINTALLSAFSRPSSSSHNQRLLCGVFLCYRVLVALPAGIEPCCS